MGFFDGAGAALIGAVGGLGQSAVNSAASAYASKAAFNRMRSWEIERATHAHQWEMQDLKAAGLNPILTATGGSGASTSSISAPVADIGLKSNPVNDAFQAMSMYQMLDKQQEEISNAKKTGENLDATKNLIDAQTAKTQADADNVNSLTFGNQVNNALSYGKAHFLLAGPDGQRILAANLVQDPLLRSTLGWTAMTPGKNDTFQKDWIDMLPPVQLFGSVHGAKSLRR